jgi:hypothetical protein
MLDSSKKRVEITIGLATSCGNEKIIKIKTTVY